MTNEEIKQNLKDVKRNIQAISVFMETFRNNEHKILSHAFVVNKEIEDLKRKIVDISTELETMKNE